MVTKENIYTNKKGWWLRLNTVKAKNIHLLMSFKKKSWIGHFGSYKVTFFVLDPILFVFKCKKSL